MPEARRAWPGACCASGVRRRHLLPVTVVLAALASLSCGSSTSTSVTAPTTPRCQVTASASPSSFPASGGPGTVTVTTTRDCTWSATAGVSWLMLGSAASGQGAGSFSFTAAANGDVTARSGTIDVNGQTISISEQPAPCQFAVSPATLSIPSSGGTVVVSVQTQAACPWTVSADVPWITVRTASGSGAATVQLTIAANAGDQRSGTLTISGQTVAVTEASGLVTPPPPTPPPPPAPNCSYAISPTSQSFSASGGTGSIAVSTTSACAWTATSNASWLSITSAAIGSGAGAVNYSVAANTDVARTATLTVAGQTVTITQAAASAPPPPPPACSYTVSPGTQKIDASGGQVSFSVSTSSTCAWSAAVNDSWLVIDSGATGTGNGTVVVDVPANSGGSRSGTVTIAGQTVNVKQSGADAVAAGPVADLSGSCPNLLFVVSSSRVATDSSTSFQKGPCKNVVDGISVNVQGTLQADQSLLAIYVTLLSKE